MNKSSKGELHSQTILYTFSLGKSRDYGNFASCHKRLSSSSIYCIEYKSRADIPCGRDTMCLESHAALKPLNLVKARHNSFR